VDWLARSLVYVHADTVVRWQRERFRRFWARRSRFDFHRMDGCRHPLWGAPRIHAELKMLGIEISERNCLPNPPEIADGTAA
jgi:hypothetical protein